MNVSGFMQAFAIDSQISPSSKDNLEHFLVHLRADKPGREQNQPQEKWGMKATRGGLPVKWVTAGISVSSQGAGLSPFHLGKRDCSPGQAKRQECANATKSLQGEWGMVPVGQMAFVEISHTWGDTWGTANCTQDHPQQIPCSAKASHQHTLIWSKPGTAQTQGTYTGHLQVEKWACN